MEKFMFNRRKFFKNYFDWSVRVLTFNTNTRYWVLR